MISYPHYSKLFLFMLRNIKEFFCTQILNSVIGSICHPVYLKAKGVTKTHWFTNNYNKHR